MKRIISVLLAIAIMLSITGNVFAIREKYIDIIIKIPTILSKKPESKNIPTININNDVVIYTLNPVLSICLIDKANIILFMLTKNTHVPITILIAKLRALEYNKSKTPQQIINIPTISSVILYLPSLPFIYIYIIVFIIPTIINITPIIFDAILIKSSVLVSSIIPNTKNNNEKIKLFIVIFLLNFIKSPT